MRFWGLGFKHMNFGGHSSTPNMSVDKFIHLYILPSYSRHKTFPQATKRPVVLISIQSSKCPRFRQSLLCCLSLLDFSFLGFLINIIIQYELFCVWLILLSIILLSFIHAVTFISNFSFYHWLALHCRNIHHFTYPFTYC